VVPWTPSPRRVGTEVARLNPDREVGGRQIGEELLLKLEVPIGFAGMREIALGVVAGPMLSLEIRPAHLDLHAAEPSVLPRVSAGVAEHVVRGAVRNHLLKGILEIVGVEERLPSSVGGERRE